MHCWMNSVCGHRLMSDTYLTQRQRDLVAGRAGYCCEYCLSQVEYCPDSFSVDHIIPRSKGGTDKLENLAFACLGCNGRKATAISEPDPSTGEDVRLYNPRLDRWEVHFAWAPDFSRLIGLTPIGRATIERLQLNREGVVNLRRALYKLDKHPPE